MANTKTIITRIKNKVDLLSTWQSSPVNDVDSSTRLLDGEIAIVRVPTGTEYIDTVTGEKTQEVALLMKVGDGSTVFSQLPWLSAKASDVYGWAKKSEEEFTAWVKTLVAVDDIDLSGYYTAEEVDGIINGIQDQLNTIVNNPDTEGVINSINEFTQYVQDHGTIADGFRADIDDLKKYKHSHTNKTVLDGITSSKVAAWDSAEANAKAYAKAYADSLNHEDTKYSAAAGGGLKLDAATNAFSIDDTITFIFDCGGAPV